MLFPVQVIARKKQLINEAIAPATSGLLFLVDEANCVWLIEKASECMYHTYRDVLESFSKEILFHRILFVYFFACTYEDELDSMFSRAVSEYRPSFNLGRDDFPVANLGYNSGDYIDRYSELSIMAKAISDELATLKPNIVSYLKELKDEVYDGDGFNIKLQKRPSYDYPSAIKSLEKRLKTMKREAEQSGEATVKSYSVFPVLKEK